LPVRACPSQAEQLRARAWPQRARGDRGRGRAGNLLAQQLVAAGEPVLDVPPKLAARVRLLQAGDANKNDPNDALPVAVAALRSKLARPVLADGHAVVLKVWAKRHRDLARLRNQACCRRHAVLADLVPGGVRREISADRPRDPHGRDQPDPAQTQRRPCLLGRHRGAYARSWRPNRRCEPRSAARGDADVA
jgi:hypothetical protein